MVKGLQFFNVQLLFEFIKNNFNARLLKKIEEDPDLGEDMSKDNN